MENEEKGLQVENIRPIHLVISKCTGTKTKRQCHFWNIYEGRVDLYEVKDGRLEQVATIGNVESVEEVSA